MSIGKRIKEQRKLLKITQPQLAEHIGISLDMVKSMETDRSNPSVETLNKLADLFVCSVDYLLGRQRNADDLTETTWAELVTMLDESIEFIGTFDKKTHNSLKEKIEKLPRNETLIKEVDQPSIYALYKEIFLGYEKIKNDIKNATIKTKNEKDT